VGSNIPQKKKAENVLRYIVYKIRGAWRNFLKKASFLWGLRHQAKAKKTAASLAQEALWGPGKRNGRGPRKEGPTPNESHTRWVQPYGRVHHCNRDREEKRDRTRFTHPPTADTRSSPLTEGTERPKPPEEPGKKQGHSRVKANVEPLTESSVPTKQRTGGERGRCSGLRGKTKRQVVPIERGETRNRKGKTARKGQK